MGFKETLWAGAVAQHVGCLPRLLEDPGVSPEANKPGATVHTCNPNTQEGQKFKATLYYIASSRTAWDTRNSVPKNRKKGMKKVWKIEIMPSICLRFSMISSLSD